MLALHGATAAVLLADTAVVQAGALEGALIGAAIGGAVGVILKVVQSLSKKPSQGDKSAAAGKQGQPSGEKP